MIEEWRPVLGYEGWYEVSDRGRVRSLKTRSGRTRTPRILASETATGRHRVILGGRGGDQRSVPELVLAAFVGPRPEGLFALHADDNRSNNDLTNLRWGTRTDNALDSVLNGTHNHASKSTCKWGHKKVRPNLVMSSPFRKCLACTRTHAINWWRKKDGLAPSDHQQTSDSYYSSIMAGGS